MTMSSCAAQAGEAAELLKLSGHLVLRASAKAAETKSPLRRTLKSQSFGHARYKTGPALTRVSSAAPPLKTADPVVARALAHRPPTVVTVVTHAQAPCGGTGPIPRAQPGRPSSASLASAPDTTEGKPEVSMGRGRFVSPRGPRGPAIRARAGGGGDLVGDTREPSARHLDSRTQRNQPQVEGQAFPDLQSPAWAPARGVW